MTDCLFFQASPIVSSTPEEHLVTSDNFKEFIPGGDSESDSDDEDGDDGGDLEADEIRTLESTYLDNTSFHSVKSTLTDETQVIDDMSRGLQGVHLACGGSRIVTEAEVHRPEQDDGYALVSQSEGSYLTPQPVHRPLPPAPSGQTSVQTYQHVLPQPPLRRSSRSYRFPRHPVCEVVVHVHQNAAAPVPVHPPAGTHSAGNQAQGVDPDLLSRTLSHRTVAHINWKRFKSDCKQLATHAGDFLFRRTH